MTAQAQLLKRGTSISLTNTGGDKTMDLKDLGFGVGRLSAFIDRGADAAPEWIELFGYAAWAANPVAGEVLNIAVCQSDGTKAEGGLTYHADNDASLTEAEFNALKQARSVVAHTADANEKSNVMLVQVTSRYYAVAAYNASAAKNLADVDGASGVIATPVYPVSQPDA